MDVGVPSHTHTLADAAAIFASAVLLHCGGTGAEDAPRWRRWPAGLARGDGGVALLRDEVGAAAALEQAAAGLAGRPGFGLALRAELFGDGVPASCRAHPNTHHSKWAVGVILASLALSCANMGRRGLRCMIC